MNLFAKIIGGAIMTLEYVFGISVVTAGIWVAWPFVFDVTYTSMWDLKSVLIGVNIIFAPIAMLGCMKLTEKMFGGTNEVSGG